MQRLARGDRRWPSPRAKGLRRPRPAAALVALWLLIAFLGAAAPPPPASAPSLAALPDLGDLSIGVMPNVRAGWRVDGRNFLWAAISRAVRTPSRLERDLTAPGIVTTSPNFDSEKLVAYEAGWRAQLARNATLSVSLFYDDYSDLRTTSPAPGGVLPVSFGNGREGHTYGGEAWTRYSPVSWWRLDAGASLLRKDFHLKPGERDIAGVQTVLGHDPGHQLFLRSYIDLPHDMDLYVGLRQIAALDDVGVGGYFETDVRIAWRPTPTLELSLAGLNLVHGAHVEASQPPVHEVPRSVYVGARWNY